MKKKHQTAADCWAEEARKTQENFEFIKTQGNLFEEAMAPLKNWPDRFRFVMEHFYQSAVQIPALYQRNAQPKETVRQAYEWGRLSLLQDIKQPMTQEQISILCNSVVSVYPESVIIDFEKGRLTWHEQEFILSHSEVSICVAGAQESNFDISFGERMKVTVYLFDQDNIACGFMKATGDDGTEYFFVLDHFSILFLLDEGSVDEHESEQLHEVSDKEDTEDACVDGNRYNGKVGMFTLFDKANNLFFATTY